ncbi:hypothetical protein OCK74_10610 [Chitinophagaceae bacterium LB-8]|uniref:Uncharacterized protein n=1 Tax=Paraflavisolibacter caeni TaxID=2982496 RepID=A0A9X2XNT2_9BACT|nr:hypothetical protein [Paraflavisolibacter caeni]MCU7549568.1 hypothetical protein [Paraflavisolibacter caeni]
MQQSCIHYLCSRKAQAFKHLGGNKLNRKNTIQRFVALMLLVIFTISITPETYFHSVLAGHKDRQTCTDAPTTGIHFHQKQKECHFDQLVVTAPYLYQPVFITFSVTLLHPVHTNLYTYSYQKLHFASTVNRGPPQA